MKKLSCKIGKTIPAAAMAALLTIALLPLSAHAEEVEKCMATMGLRTGAIANPASGYELKNGENENKSQEWDGDYVYFGKNADRYGTPNKYRVLSYYTTDFSWKTAILPGNLTLDGGTVLLESDEPWYEWVQYKFSENGSNVWSQSDLKTKLNSYFLSNGYDDSFYARSFSAAEKNAIAQSIKLKKSSTDGETEDGTIRFGFAQLTGEKVFVLDVAEITNSTYGYCDTFNVDASRDYRQKGMTEIQKAQYYFLRSPKENTSDVIAAVSDSAWTNGEAFPAGGIDDHMSANGLANCFPAINLRRTSILFSSIPDTSRPKEFKLTVVDEDMNLEIPEGACAIKNGKTFTVPYTLTGDHAGEATQMSVLMTDKAYNLTGAQIKYYGKLELAETPAGSTAGSYTVPDDFDPDWITYIIAEDINGGKETDYASKPVQVSFDHVHSLTYSSVSGKSNQISAKCANVFSCTQRNSVLQIDAPAHTVFGDGNSPEAVITDEGHIRGTAKILYYKADANGNTVGSPLSSAPSNAGKYRAQITIDDCTAYVVYEIARAEIPQKNITMQDYAYGGDIYKPTLSHHPEGITPTVYYSKSNSTSGGTEWKNMTSTSLDPGTYYMYGFYAQSANYLACTTATREFKVSKGGNPASFQNAEVPLGGNTIELSSLVKDARGTVSYKLKQDPTGACQLDEKTGSFTSGMTKGTCIVTVKAAGDKYYSEKSADISVSVIDKYAMELAVTLPDVVFGDALSEPSYTLPAEPIADAEICYVGTLWDDSPYEATTDAPTEAGSYKVNVKEETADTFWYGEAAFSIMPRSIKEAEVTLSASVFDYDGKDHTVTINAVTLDKEQLVYGRDYTVKGVLCESDPNTYEVVLTGRGNYNGSVTASWKIIGGPDNGTEDKAAADPAKQSDTGKETDPAGHEAIEAGGLLMAKMIAKGKTNLVLSWNKIEGADGYDIYFEKCSRRVDRYITEKAVTIEGSNTLKWTKKGLEKGEAYKACVKAYVIRNGEKEYVSASPVLHAFAGNGSGKYTNAKKVKAKKKLSLKKGKSAKLKVTVKGAGKNRLLMQKSHAAKLRFASSDEKIATVNKKGKVKGVSKGSCVIFAYAHNGVCAKIKVNVK